MTAALLISYIGVAVLFGAIDRHFAKSYSNNEWTLVHTVGLAVTWPLGLLFVFGSLTFDFVRSQWRVR